MLRIKLNKKEYNYLCQASFIADQYRKLFFSSEHTDDGYLLKMSPDQADDLRNLCGERLQLAGFDQNYELTSEGEILESLVDKFFTA